MIYLAKQHHWYVPYTIVTLEDDHRTYDETGRINWNAGLFRGFRKKEYPSESPSAKMGEVYEDGEICSFDEFWELSEKEMSVIRNTYASYCNTYRIEPIHLKGIE